MERIVGTISRGLRTPIIMQGDDIAQIASETVIKASEQEGFSINNRDVLAITDFFEKLRLIVNSTMRQNLPDLPDRKSVV